MIFKWVLVGTFFASFSGQDYDGKWNHLYEWKDQNGTPHHVAFRHDDEIDPVNVRSIKVQCKAVMGVDEATSDRVNQWVSYRAFICNGFEVTMMDKKVVVVDEELKEEVEKEALDLQEIMKKNAENKRRMAEERRNENKKVLKSYRIK